MDSLTQEQPQVQQMENESPPHHPNLIENELALQEKSFPEELDHLEPLKKQNLFLSSDESDQFIQNFNSESEKTIQKEIISRPTLFICNIHNFPIKLFCKIHFDYLCDECKKEHLSHIRSLEEFGLKELTNNFLNLEGKLTKIKNIVIEYQKSLKTIIENETTKSEDILLILKNILQFLSKPILNTKMVLKRRRLKSHKKIPQISNEIKSSSKEIKPSSSKEINPSSKELRSSSPVNSKYIPNSKLTSKPKFQKEIIPISRLISDSEDQAFIKLLLENNLHKNEGLILIFRASKDGFKVNDFHRMCDDKPRTLVIIKSNFDNIFGGFSNHPWKSYPKGQYVEDSDAFLFSLTYHTKHKQMKNNEFALYLTENYGPVFGKGYDLCVKDECNKKFKNYSKLGNSYLGPAEMEMKDNYCYLGGGEYFAIEEYEVFQIKELF